MKPHLWFRDGLWHCKFDDGFTFVACTPRLAYVVWQRWDGGGMPVRTRVLQSVLS